MFSGIVEDGRGAASKLMADTPDDAWSDLGFVPYPGTLNVRVRAEARNVLRDASRVKFRVGPTLGRWREYLPVTVNGYPCYGRFTKDKGVIELVADVRLRDHLVVSNGDTVEVAAR